MEEYVALERQFSPVAKTQEDVESEEALSLWGLSESKTWQDLDREFRVVILAEAGAGKTEELLQRASDLASQGRPSFFIRIEDIEVDFYNAFEVGNKTKFKDWLQSTEEAWFFLDSVDESRLENPGDFKKALRRFAHGIKEGAHRAHIYLSSRPYAWRPKEDRRLLDELLYLPALKEGGGSEEEQQSGPQSALTIYKMCPLDQERIRHFCMAREASDIDCLLREVDRTGLWNLAGRPFDLEGILAKWSDDGELGSRLELFHHNISKRLRDEHNSDRAQRQPLNLETAKDGARRLAAAVVLTGKAGLNVPDALAIKPGIDADSVLADWDPADVRALMERGVFNDVIYGAVRFRNREILELLAAEWFDKLLKTGNSRYSVETLFFREQYGEKIITLRLRPVLPWLILFDDEIRRRALEICPEIAIEDGDPSQLPLPERRAILMNIVSRIVAADDDRSGRDNSAIARIANLDLSEDTQKLIRKYGNNDDAIFFLGRLVWQGEMVSCVPHLINIAVDSSRGIYARIASTRAVMTCGSVEQKIILWQQLNDNDEKIPRRLLVEIIQEAEPDANSIDHLVISLGKLPPYERYETNGLDGVIHTFIEHLPIVDNQQPIIRLLNGLHSYLEKPPYVERRECHVSEEYAWLLGPATHVVEKLIEMRSTIAMGGAALSIMLMVPALRHWHGNDFSEHKDNLRELVPDWPEINDALYWASIVQARISKEHSGEALTDDWSVSWLGHFWSFDEASLPRLCDYMHSRSLQDDKSVSLSTAFRVYAGADKPSHILTKLKEAVADNSTLQHQLDTLLYPPVSVAMQKYEKEEAERERKWDEKKEREKQARETWIAELRENPDRVRIPLNVKSGEFTNDQLWLMHELQDRGASTKREVYANWQDLIPDFGEAVALAYHDAAVNHWRHYMPPLRSEGAQGNSIPYSLIFAMAGLEMEAAENPEFPCYLDESTARHALRYVTWELNGFPPWFERMHRAFPDLLEQAVIKELVWELENTGPDEPMHYILADLDYHAPWLHTSIAQVILKWAEDNPTRINVNRHYCLNILAKGGTDAATLSKLASLQLAQNNDLDSFSVWYALRVDCEPEKGILEVEKWLSGLKEEDAINAAQVFITTLLGGRHVEMNGPYFSHFRTVEHLKSLYVLMHRYIRVKDDINRSGGGTYSPCLRDDAQDARGRLFSLLLEIPGKASYSAIKQLIKEHPDPERRPWMDKHAYKKAEQDGDLEPWKVEQVYNFNQSQTLKPNTHRQLYELTVGRLLDLKNWLERGNDSPYQTWQRAEDEPEMRNLIAGWLNQQRQNRYITAQEPELANSQRMDIWIQNTNSTSPVPIELKLLDKEWSGPHLCERLRNQLAGDYLREETAGCGVMLLVWRGVKHKKRWEINGRRVSLNELANELKNYWENIAGLFDNVEAIKVIVIDLSMRDKISDS
ncbi:MAG: hypothetical protein OEZ39_17140 [Gammaproteobacteria bacterium]|nr:hypothetical protein [Gammaproteobacteria bacterium]MDH5653588.1 hypothetical protein [Gammaproteobacteria bacterium]